MKEIEVIKQAVAFTHNQGWKSYAGTPVTECRHHFVPFRLMKLSFVHALSFERNSLSKRPFSSVMLSICPGLLSLTGL